MVIFSKDTSRLWDKVPMKRMHCLYPYPNNLTGMLHTSKRSRRNAELISSALNRSPDLISYNDKGEIVDKHTIKCKGVTLNALNSSCHLRLLERISLCVCSQTCTQQLCLILSDAIKGTDIWRMKLLWRRSKRPTSAVCFQTIQRRLN